MVRGQRTHALAVVVLCISLHGTRSATSLFRRLHSNDVLSPPQNFTDQPSLASNPVVGTGIAGDNARQVNSLDSNIHAVATTNVSGTTSLDFADGYGTTFECTSVCHFITISFALAIGVFFILLLVVPVSTTNYVKSSTRKRTSKRPLDVAAGDVPYQAASHGATQAVHSRDRRPVGHSDVDDSDDGRRNYVDPSDAARYDFIASLSTGKKDTEPLMKVVRTARMLSPRSHRLGGMMAQSPSAIARATSTHQEMHHGRSTKVPLLSVPATSYENLRDEEIQETEYREFVHQLTSDGLVLKRIKTKSRGVKIAKWRIRLTLDMTTLHLTKHDGLHVLKKTESVHVKDVVGMTTGTLEAGGAVYLSLLQADNSSLDFQADNEAIHQKVYNGFGMLLREHDRAKHRLEA